MPMPNRIEVKSGKKGEPIHPCDPPKPCNPHDEGEGECPKPTLFLERLKNPMKPHETRCKPGAHINTVQSKREEPPHPCDPPLPCVPGKPKKLPCPEVALFYERIKNPDSKVIRCPGPNDLASVPFCENLELMKIPLPPCNLPPCTSLPPIYPEKPPKPPCKCPDPDE